MKTTDGCALPGSCGQNSDLGCTAAMDYAVPLVPAQAGGNSTDTVIWYRNKNQISQIDCLLGILNYGADSSNFCTRIL